MRNRVVITGIGGICGLGTDAASIWASMREGRSTIGPIENSDLHELKIRVGSEIKALPDHGIDADHFHDPEGEMVLSRAE